jgi:hypothetical protein
MRLDISFDPGLKPESQQHQLCRIPPAGQIEHPAIRAALERYEQARKAEHETRQIHTQLELELPAAEYRDEVALADAREKGKPDPGPKIADRHRAAMAEAKRDWGARKIALTRAIEAVQEAFEAHGDEYEASLVAERDQLRDLMAAKVDGLTAIWHRLQVNTVGRAVARGTYTGQKATLYANSFRAPRIHDGDVVLVADALEGLRGLAAPQEPAGATENLPLGTDPTRAPRLSDERRAERMNRAESRRAQREAEQEAAHAAAS